LFRTAGLRDRNGILQGVNLLYVFWIGRIDQNADS
jgi:hypothetical protein